MDDEDVSVLAVEESTGDIFVGAVFGTYAYDWPTLIHYKDRTYKFASNDAMPHDLAALFGGYARYKLIATQRVMELRLCEQRHLVLRPDQLYYFTADPNCKACMKIADGYKE